jgi:hypothetical protein
MSLIFLVYFLFQAPQFFQAFPLFSTDSTTSCESLLILSPFAWLGFCNPCNLSCFLLFNNSKHSLSSHSLYLFNLKWPKLALAEIMTYPPIFPPNPTDVHIIQVCQSCKLYDIITTYCYLVSSDQISEYHTLLLLIHLLTASPSVLLPPNSCQYHNQPI